MPDLFITADVRTSALVYFKIGSPNVIDGQQAEQLAMSVAHELKLLCGMWEHWIGITLANDFSRLLN